MQPQWCLKADQRGWSALAYRQRDLDIRFAPWEYQGQSDYSSHNTACLQHLSQRMTLKKELSELKGMDAKCRAKRAEVWCDGWDSN